MASLKNEHKKLIVMGLATCEDAAEVQTELKVSHDVDALLQQIVYYNAEKSPKLAKKWRHLFYDTRRKYIEEVSSIPIANKGFRLNEMQKIFGHAKRLKNHMLSLKILEQAAKEVGGIYEEMKNADTGLKNSTPLYQQINRYFLEKRGSNK